VNQVICFRDPSFFIKIDSLSLLFREPCVKIIGIFKILPALRPFLYHKALFLKNIYRFREPIALSYNMYHEIGYLQQ